MIDQYPQLVKVATVVAYVGITYFVLLAIFAIARAVDQARHAERYTPDGEKVSPAKRDELRERR